MCHNKCFTSHMLYGVHFMRLIYEHEGHNFYNLNVSGHGFFFVYSQEVGHIPVLKVSKIYL